MVVKNKAIADPSFTTSSEENNNNNNNNNKEATTVIPSKSRPRGFYRCDRPTGWRKKKRAKSAKK